MYIETKRFKVKFKASPIVFILSGLLLNLYYQTSLAEQIEFVEEIKED